MAFHVQFNTQLGVFIQGIYLCRARLAEREREREGINYYSNHTAEWPFPPSRFQVLLLLSPGLSQTNHTVHNSTQLLGRGLTTEWLRLEEYIIII